MGAGDFTPQVGPRFVRREGDVGYFTPAGGGPERAVHLPSAPTFARLADQAAQHVAPPAALMAPPAPVAPGTGPVRYPNLGFDQAAPAPAAAPPPAAPAQPRTMVEQAQQDIGRIRRAQPAASPFAPQADVAAAERMFSAAPNAPTQTPYVGEGFVDINGNPVTPGVAQPPPAPGARPGGGRPRPAAPQQPVDPNAALISELTNRPEGAAPLVPYDFRGESIPERTARSMDEARQLEQARAEATGTGAAEYEDQLQNREAANRELEATRQDAMRAARQRLEGAMRRMNEARINPNRYFDERGGAAGRIGAAIATALGAVGGALMGTGGNEALGIIQQEIERDLDAQRQNQAQTRAGVDAARSFLDVTRQEFSDQQAAEDAAQALAWQAVSQRIAQQGARLQSEEARQRAQALQLQADQQAEAAAATAAEREFRTEMELRSLRAQTLTREARAAREMRRAAGGGAGAALPMPPSWTQGPEAWAGLTRAQQQAAIGRLGTRAEPGGGAGAPTADMRQRFAAATDAVSQLQQAVPESGDIPGIGAIDSRRGTGWFQSAEGRRVRTLGANAVRRYLRLESGAAISEDEMNQEMEIRGMGEGASEAQFREGMRQLARDLQARAEALGLNGPQGREEAAALPPGVRRR